MSIRIDWNSEELQALHAGRIMPAIGRAVRMAGSTALRDMKAEAKKRIRARKRMKAGLIGRSFRMRRPKGKDIDGGEWGIDVRGDRVPLTAYPHRQTKRGVSVEVNRGKRSLVRGAFIATMKSGRRGVFLRDGKARLPIREQLGSRPVDALLHKGEAEGVRERGARSFGATFTRVLPLELEKVQAKARQMASRAKPGQG